MTQASAPHKCDRPMSLNLQVYIAAYHSINFCFLRPKEGLLNDHR